MTDIQAEAELRHPVRRVWRALTDQQLLGQWLGATDLRPLEGTHFQLRPVDLPGLDGEIDGEVVELDEPHRLVLRWQEGDVPVLVSYELTSTEQGCLLTVHQSGTDGHWAPEQHEQRQQGYTQLLTGPLPAVLDWLAFREIDFTAESTVTSAPATTASDGVTVIAPTNGGRRGPDRRRRRLTVGLIIAAIVTGATMVVVAVTRTSGEETTAASGTPTATATGSPAASPDVLPPAAGGVPSRAGEPQVTATATPSANPSAASPSAPFTSASATAGGAAPPGQASLDARYARASSELLGYTGEIVLTNSGTVDAAQWVVTVGLYGGATIASASGASYQQRGKVVTFAGSPVPPGGSARFTFQVNAALSERQPESCTVGDRPCAGV